MPSTTKPEAPPPREAEQGIIVAAPSALGEAFHVVIPSYSAEHVFEVRRWDARQGKLPAVDDECLVILDDTEEAWVPAFWPAVGAGEALTKGCVVHNADATVPRPGGFASVEWIGSVEPLNALDNDTWVNNA